MLAIGVYVCVLGKVVNRLILCNLSLQHLCHVPGHVFLLDYHILDVLVQFELLAQGCSPSRVYLVVTKVDRLDLLEDASELGDELDALVDLHVLQ